ncbi:MAG: 3-keto-disaccharide hydrolase [Planctomycetota bacterium]
MRSNTRIDLCLMGGILVFAAFAGVLAVCLAGESQAEKPGGNSKCYVCHPDMKTEELTTDHLDMEVACDECHGASTEHMHDETLMTKPDLLFGRAEVAKMCSNPTCHKPGGGREVYGRQDHGDPVAVEAFFKKWAGRMSPNGRTVAHDSVCTDCHGTHNISKPLETQSEGDQPAEWVAAFNGRDLTGWRPSGTASWTVETGRIVGTPGTNEEGSTLWTEAMYEDYLLAVTFRAAWPIHAGIWLRGAGSKPGPRVEICEPSEAGKSAAFTGSVRVPGKGLALVNLREDLVDRESWNTISVRVEGDRIQVWLNGEEIGAVRLITPAKGKIGLHIQKHPASKSAELSVREVLIQRLGHAE